MGYTITHSENTEGEWDEIAGEGRDELTGYGQVNAEAAVDLALAKRFVIRDSAKKHVASFDDQGNLVIEGELHASASTSNLNAWSTNNAEDFVIRDSGNTVVARFEDNGDLYIKGALSEEQSSPTPSGDEAFKIKLGSNVVALIDTDGNLKLEGPPVPGRRSGSGRGVTVRGPASSADRRGDMYQAPSSARLRVPRGGGRRGAMESRRGGYPSRDGGASLV